MVCRGAVLVVMMAVVLCSIPTMAIPSRVANRMIPSWWINARQERTCSAGSQCGVGECCVRPMLATNSYCFPYKGLGETCHADGMMLDMNHEVFYDHCPCQSQLTCANLMVSSVCVDPNTIEDHHRFNMIPKPAQINRGP